MEKQWLFRKQHRKAEYWRARKTTTIGIAIAGRLIFIGKGLQKRWHWIKTETINEAKKVEA